MSVASAWPAIVNALVAKMRARSGYCSPVSGITGTVVYHSVEVGLSSHSTDGGLLTIGWVGDPDTITIEAGSANQTVATLGTGHHRQETGTVSCMAQFNVGDAQLGGDGAPADGTVGWAIAQAFAIVDDVDAVIRADPSLGVHAPDNPDISAVVAYIEGVPMIEPWLNEGLKVKLLFSVHYSARI